MQMQGNNNCINPIDGMVEVLKPGTFLVCSRFKNHCIYDAFNSRTLFEIKLKPDSKYIQCSVNKLEAVPINKT